MQSDDKLGKRQGGKYEKLFPLVKKYGGLVVALTLDERGIPETAEERVKIAEKILETASKYGIEKKDIIFDTLAMTISASKNAAVTTLAALSEIRQSSAVSHLLEFQIYPLGCRREMPSTVLFLRWRLKTDFRRP